MEVSRKHGPFDTRWPSLRKDSPSPAPAASLDPAEVAEALDWNAFSTRHFPNRKRHDSQARSAYAAYRQGRGWRTTPPRLSLVPPEHVSAAVELEREEAGTGRLLEAIAAAHPRETQNAPAR